MDPGFSPEWDPSSPCSGTIQYLLYLCVHLGRDSTQILDPITISKHTSPLLVKITQCPFCCSNVNIYQEKTEKYDPTHED